MAWYRDSLPFFYHIELYGPGEDFVVKKLISYPEFETLIFQIPYQEHWMSDGFFIHLWLP
jgi:hypothetical protein